MTAQVVNLRRVRKARDRSAAAAQADANRAKFGRTTAQKHADTIEAARRDRALDGAKRDDS